MTTTIISNQSNYTFGAMTNSVVSKLIAVNTQMARLKDAIATASSGYTGEPGTEFEAPVSTTGAPVNPTNLFGVMPDPGFLGKNGTDYAYAVNSLEAAWATFWAAAEAYIDQLDNGGGSL